MKKYLQFIILAGLTFLMLTACKPVSSAVGIKTSPSNSTPQEVVVQPELREAQVQSVEIQLLRNEPVQVNAIVRGNLTESCATFDDTQLSYASNTFHIKLLTKSPADRGCLQVITPYEQTIPLNITDLAPGTYTVAANGVSAVFTIPDKAPPSPTSLQLVVRASDGTFQVANLNLPLNPTARPTFNGFLPSGGSAAGSAYVLDPNQAKAFVTDGRGFQDLVFIQSPMRYGLAVWPGDANTQPRLAWATQNIGGDTSSTIKVSNVDGTRFDTLLTQDALNPPSQLMAQFFSADGQSLYFSKEPVGLGGYILFGGSSNLYKINISTKEVAEVIPQGATDSLQVCLDAFSADFHSVADHCAQNTITVRDLSSGKTTTIRPPADAADFKFVGSARFSPDSSRLAFALARGNQQAEQGWIAVSDDLSGSSRLILTAQPGSYFTVAGWLDDQTLLVESTNPLVCSPFCKSELWTVKADGTGAQKVVDGSFLAVVPNDAFIQLPQGATPTPVTTVCTDAAEYVSDDRLDGTTYAPNAPFTKTWTLKNTGSCTWGSNYLVSQISGAFMTQQPSYRIVPQGQTVAPGQTVDISIGMTSPTENGNYRSYWGLKKENGQLMPILGGANGKSFYVEINVNNGSISGGEVTTASIDIELEQGSGASCTADATYFVHASITADGPTTASYEIGSTAGQISAGYFEDENRQYPYVTGKLVFNKSDTKRIGLRFVGPYPYPEDITVMLRVDGGDWHSSKLSCP